MTAFTIQVAQNQYLAPGARQVHAVVNITSSRQGAAAAPARPLVEALLIDCSTSMTGDRIEHARAALERAIDMLRDDAWFCIIAGTETGRVAFPLSQATATNKRAAHEAARQLQANGGTAMSTWLAQALAEFRKMPDGIHHALLLTDGKNEGESDDKLRKVLAGCEGQFQCDARGVGTGWTPDQLRQISGKLLGTVDIIPRPADIEADFRAVLSSALDKSVSDVQLRLWTPQGANVEFCTLAYPQKVDLTQRARPSASNPQVRDYPTGSWGEEKRDYHLCLTVSPGKVGQRMCAGRVSLVSSEAGQEVKHAEAMILAVWTEDEAQSAVINPSVAHYTGQAELADAIRDGLEARSRGDTARAEALLGRAVQLASESNPETMKLLRAVVQVEDEKQGTVKLLRNVRKEDEFALDTRSTKTARVQKE
jgi:uncharacterized protein YegL